MTPAEIDALLRTHADAATVASLHVLRQARLEAHESAFLEAHAEGVVDLARWHGRAEPDRTRAIVVRLAELAVGDPDCFEHEALPTLRLSELERRELVELLDGRVPEELLHRVRHAPVRLETSPAHEDSRPAIGAPSLCVHYLVERLGTRSGWEAHGRAAVSALVAARDWTTLCDLFTFAYLEAWRAPGVTEADLRAPLRAAHGAFALALIDALRRDVADDERRALLAGLCSLEPPPHVIGELRRLRREVATSDDATTLLDLAIRKARRATGDGDLEGLVAAVIVLADALGSSPRLDRHEWMGDGGPG